MKNIAQYFVDPLRTVDLKTPENPGHRKESRGKRNRVKIRISRATDKESICNIIETSNDMIDKTPSPYTKVTSSDNVHYEMPKTSQRHCNSNHLSVESGDNNSSSSLLDDGKDGSFVTQQVESIDLSSDEEESSQQSNAFQILMSNNKCGQNTSPTKQPIQNDEVSAKKTEEYKQKLKRCREKLIALADNKGYSKRKLTEMEESEKMERIIQNRIKVLKGDDRKDNNASMPVLSQSQQSGSLLNYFSKVPVDLGCVKNVSTIVVKADVHVAEDSALKVLCAKNLSNGNYLTKNNLAKNSLTKNKKSNLEFSAIDNIEVIESENISISNDREKQHTQNKRRWSLRIKLQTNEEENSVPDGKSDEEIFSPKSKAKLTTENTKRRRRKSTSSVDTPLKDKNKKMLNSKSRKVEWANSKESKSKGKQEVNGPGEQDINLSSLLNNNSESKLSQEDCISIADNNSKRKTTDKLAPLFTKRLKPDPKTVAARRLFLQSDIVDNNGKNSDRKSNINGILPFPIISHVTQLNDVSFIQTSNLNVRMKLCNQYVPVFAVSNFKHIMDFSEVKSKPMKEISKPKVQEALTEIEKRCSDTKKIWDAISLTVKGQPNKPVTPKTRAKRKSKQTEIKDVESTDKENQIQSSVWTHKYKPTNIEQVVGNEAAAAKLREWLIGWKAKLTNGDVSSEDEFYSSDSSSLKVNENNQVAVLLGPHGSGKTASVYAVAEEFGYTVLEVNASSRRAGKKILKELEEATKSHRIKKEQNPAAFFNSVSDEVLPKKIPQNSLILIEDVDLVFEEDEGFVSATYQLASNTKRPIVMTCRDVCPHLVKIAPQQNRIYFQNAIGNRVFVLLELISLAETGYRLPHNCVTKLLQTGDLRKAILQLQYLLLSGPPEASELSMSIKNALWQNMQYYLYKPMIKVSTKRKTKKVKNENETTSDTRQFLRSMSNRLDSVALLSSLVVVDDPTLNLCHVKTQPSLSLAENTAPYSVSSSISSEIAEWINETVLFKDESDEHDGTQYQNNIMLKKTLNNGVNLALSQTTSFLLDYRVMSTDYLPSIRAICRAEEYRANMNNKRGNRFFHYLHSLKVPSTSLKPNILAAACKIMHDKIDNNSYVSENSGNLA